MKSRVASPKVLDVLPGWLPEAEMIFKRGLLRYRSGNVGKPFELVIGLVVCMRRVCGLNAETGSRDIQLAFFVVPGLRNIDEFF